MTIWSEKNIIEGHQRNESYNVPGITEYTVLTEQIQGTGNGIIPTPSGDSSPLIVKTQLHDERGTDTVVNVSRICDVAAEFKVFKESQMHVEKMCKNWSPLQRQILMNQLRSRKKSFKIHCHQYRLSVS